MLGKRSSDRGVQVQNAQNLVVIQQRHRHGALHVGFAVRQSRELVRVDVALDEDRLAPKGDVTGHAVAKANARALRLVAPPNADRDERVTLQQQDGAAPGGQELSRAPKDRVDQDRQLEDRVHLLAGAEQQLDLVEAVGEGGG